MAPRNYFEQALQDEGILGTPLESLARSTFGQESSGGRNTATSYAGATGPMQVMPGTFKGVADPGWDINDPLANSRAGIRYLKQGWQASQGDPRLTAAYYYGGPGGMEKLARGVAVGDPRNPNAPTTAQYANQVLNRAGSPNTGTNMASPNGIMNQADRNQLPEYTPNPILRQSPDAGILDRIGNAPGFSDALIQMGAGLLSSTGQSNPLATGMSRGFAGFSKGYDQGLENVKARVIPIAGGAFSQITDAQGNVTVVPNSSVQRYIGDAKAKEIENWKGKTVFKADAEVDAAGRKLGQKTSLEDTPALESAMADVKLLRTVVEGLKQNPDATGGWTGILPKEVRDYVDPSASNFQQQAEGVALKSLRSIFGAQFTENEGKQFLARYYNPRLPAKDNAANLQRMADDIESLAKNKQAASAYLAKNGSLAGFKADTGTSTVPAPGKVETQPLPPVGGGNADDPLGLNLKKR